MLTHRTHAHTLRTLHKWSSKVLAISPNLLMSSHRPTFSSKSSQNQKAKGAVQLVDEVLSDLDKLRARTRILRTGRELTAATTAAGVEENETEGREIFDDADFYQGLLRDVIASRTEGAEQEGWLIEQKRRRKEKKKVVDTKASKGRKLRSGHCCSIGVFPLAITI
jgi:protein AATF/BFR2